MKIGREMPRVLAALERTELLDRAVYVSRATMPEQRIERDLRQVAREHGDCFAMVVVAKKERSGVLLGEVPDRDATSTADRRREPDDAPGALRHLRHHPPRHRHRRAAGAPPCPSADLYVSEKLFARGAPPGALPLPLPMGPLLADTFTAYDCHVFVISVGAVVRMVAPLLQNKKVDPAVLCVDDAGRFTICVLSGHVGPRQRLHRAGGGRPAATSR